MTIPDTPQAMVWVTDEVIPHTTKESVVRIALYFARHGHLSRREGLRNADRHRIPQAINLSNRTVYESLDDMVNMDLLVEYRNGCEHVYFLNLDWVPARKRGVRNGGGP